MRYKLVDTELGYPTSDDIITADTPEQAALAALISLGYTLEDITDEEA